MVALVLAQTILQWGVLTPADTGEEQQGAQSDLAGFLCEAPFLLGYWVSPLCCFQLWISRALCYHEPSPLS